MSFKKDSVKNYWDEFYATKTLGVEDIPSQFATFVMTEFSTRNNFIDIGCGNGRDSFFFAKHANNVIGADASTSALDFCNQKVDHNAIRNITFQPLDLAEQSSCSCFISELPKDLKNTVLYARFLLHAIDEQAESNFLNLCRDAAEQGAAIAIEFRTHRDAQQTKETSAHYRRFINPLEFMDRARSFNLNLTYFTEGFGLAKYKNDDAHVARFVFS